MITYTRNDLIHWNYFIALEKDMEKVSRYIEFCTENEKTYSIEIAKILMSSASEIDVLLKLICSVFNDNADKISQYRSCIVANCPQLIQEEYFISRFSLSGKPWENWMANPEKNPDWWRSYNNVKHKRNLHYAEANVKNALNSLGALLIVIVYYYKLKTGNDFRDITRQFIPESILFRLSDSYYYSSLIV